MGFRNNTQRAECCIALLSVCSLGHYWMTGAASGPTEDAVGELRRVLVGKSALSRGEGILLRLAFDLWNGAGGVSLWEMMEYLSPSITELVGDLMVAMADGEERVDVWLARLQESNPETDSLAKESRNP